MIRTFALGIFTLLAAVSFASAEEKWEGLAGNYKERSGGEATIKEVKGPGYPWRFVLKGEGDWACGEGEKGQGEGKPRLYFIYFAEGPFKDQRYYIVRGENGKVKELQLEGGSKAVWVKQ